MSCSDPRGSLLDEYGAEEQKQFWDDILCWDQPEVSALQFGTPPSHAPLNPESMGVHPPPLAQQPGTSQPSNITNAADAAKREKIRESKIKSREKKEKERRENAEKVVEFAKQMNDLREVNASLEKEVVEAKIKQKKDEQELSNFKEEVSRLNNKLKGQTMQKKNLRDSKLTRSMKRIRAEMVKINEGHERIRAGQKELKRIRAEMVKINEGQERIRAGQKELREKFEEIRKETAKPKEETNKISKQSAANQARFNLMFQIVKARSENDAPKEAALTQILWALINGEAEPGLKRAKHPRRSKSKD